MMVNIKVEICREGARLPKYANEGDAGMDVYVCENIIVSCGETVVVPIGLKMAIPKGYEIQVRPRSGLSLKTPLRVSNSPGTIDQNFKGEIGILITNTSTFDGDFNGILDLNDKENAHGDYLIKKGDRIAQLVLSEVPRMDLEVVNDVSCIGGNRGGGFGSSGSGVNDEK
jgi:dUTP pyrophosphatase